MNTRTLRIALSIGLVSAFSLTASAAPASMANMDLNGDTFIDKTEFLSGANQKFTDMDADANGVVTKDERASFKELKREEIAQRRFEHGDVNSDGAISQQEFEEVRAERDQKREVARAERREKRQARGDDRKDRRGDRERFHPDANDDGVIDVAEHTAAAERAFTRMDKDGDGLLAQDEQKHSKRRGDRKRHRSRR